MAGFPRGPCTTLVTKEYDTTLRTTQFTFFATIKTNLLSSVLFFCRLQYLYQLDLSLSLPLFLSVTVKKVKNVGCEKLIGEKQKDHQSLTALQIPDYSILAKDLWQPYKKCRPITPQKNDVLNLLPGDLTICQQFVH
jgi:hypothetical protein